MTRILGVDYGRKRIGLAISDPDRRIASPLAVYERKGEARDSQYFRELVQTEQVATVVVGLPRHTSGREGVLAAEARKFGEWLGQVVERPIAFWDERFTTVRAEQSLWDAGLTHRQRQARRDKVAAQIMLQDYLDSLTSEPPASESLA